MGRKAGHLALGIGKAAGATLTLIAEEFGDAYVPFADDLRHRRGRDHQAPRHGPAFRRRRAGRGADRQARPGGARRACRTSSATTTATSASPRSTSRARSRRKSQGRLSERGIRVTLIDKNIGYELRCADPIPFDAEYCRDLGYSAIRFLLGGGSGAMVSIQGGRLVPIRFDDLREPETGKTRVRLVDTAARATASPAPT